MDFNSMKTSSQPSKPFRLSDFLHRRIHRYALMAMFTMGSVALAQSAQAEVVDTPTNITIKANYGHRKLAWGIDLNNDGVTDFTLNVGFERLTCIPLGFAAFSFVHETPATGNGAEGFPFPAALGKGDPIGPSQTFYAQEGLLEDYHGCSGTVTGRFGTAKAYLGLMLRSKGETYYGWARLSVIANQYEASVTLTGYAYETTPGKPINAGQTSGTINGMDEDSSGGAYLTNPIPDAVQPVSLRALAPWNRGVLCRRKEPVGAAS